MERGLNFPGFRTMAAWFIGLLTEWRNSFEAGYEQRISELENRVARLEDIVLESESESEVEV